MLPDTLRNFLVQSEDSFDSAVDIKELEDDKLNISIALNESEAEDYQKIQGLGEVLSHRIIKYRNLLGGFYRKEQLLEVYGIDSTLFEEIEPYISIDYKNLEHLNVNELGANNLSKHPYITYNMALIVTRDRKKNGPFKNKKELMNRGLLNEHLYSKIAPYITVK
jgi:competence protein ComEA